MYLFFDTETTGLPRDWRAPLTDFDNWPRMVQLAYIVCDDAGNKITSRDFLIKPVGFSIPEDASRIHGITTEYARQNGMLLIDVLNEFYAILNKADYLVAHNMSFDEKIVGAEFLRNGVGNSLPAKTRICTMQSSTAYCGIPGPYGLKWPKLSELHRKLFSDDFSNAHDAVADISATAKCFWELCRLGVIRIPAR